MPQIDRAYCHQTDSVLTIYEVRDLHFDENDLFDASYPNATYECPDANCHVELRGVNHTAAEFKTVPHFRVLKHHDHSDECELGRDAERQDARNKEPLGVGEQRDYKDSEYPTELLLERQPPPRGTGKPRIKGEPKEASNVVTASTGSNDGAKAPHRTSCLEHIVETYLEHGETLRGKVLLTIGGNTWWYPNAFTPIKWFYKNPPGRIYWGYVHEIKPYGQGYSITFVDRPRFQNEDRKVGIYLSEELIGSYRKRGLFRRYIDALLDKPNGSVRCYLVGAYPTLKPEPVKGKDGKPLLNKKGKPFIPLEVHITNLDHLVLRFDEDEESIDD